MKKRLLVCVKLPEASLATKISDYSGAIPRTPPRRLLGVKRKTSSLKNGSSMRCQ